MFDPYEIKSASDLPAQLPAVVLKHNNLKLKTKQPLSYSFNWLREVALGAISGDVGVKIDAGVEVSAGAVISANVRQEISLDDKGRLRLQVFKQDNRDYDFAASLAVGVQLETPLPGEPDELVAALLGIHREQAQEQLKKLGQAARDTVAELAALWRMLASGSNQVSTVENYLAQNGWLRRQLEEIFGPVRTEADVSRLVDGLRTLLKLRESIYAKALAALERKKEAEISYHYQRAERETALLDCSYAFTPEGLEAYRRSLDGDYGWILSSSDEHTEIRQGLLTYGLETEATLELHLPLLSRQEWKQRLESFARMEASLDSSGRILVYTVDAKQQITSRNNYQSVLALAGSLRVGRKQSGSNFTLSYWDERQAPANQAARLLAPVLAAYGFGEQAGRWIESACAGRSGNLNVRLELSVPDAAVSSWLEAPGEREPSFFETYARVSKAVQSAMRLWLPYVYFSNIERYETLDAAFPLLVYQASPPFNPKPKYDFYYDVTSERSMASFYRASARQLPKELARIEQLLLAAGRNRAAAYYSPACARSILASVQQRPRLLNSLLVADADLIEALVKLGCRGAELRTLAGKNPSSAVRALSRFAAEFVKAFHSRLRRLYAGREFLSLGAMLLVEATRALAGASAAACAASAVLRLNLSESNGAAALTQTLVNQIPPPTKQENSD